MKKLVSLAKSWTWGGVIVLIIAFVFCLATAYYNYYQISQEGQIKWSSPDETANYFFAENFSRQGQLAIFEPLNLASYDLVHPRSFRSDLGWLKPVSFLGVILIFGKIGSWLGAWIIPYLTPIFASLGIIFFYALIKRLFSQRIALLSASLLASFPVYIYYSVRSMFHNILFIVFVIISFYFLSFFQDKKYAYRQRSFFTIYSGRDIYLGFLWMFLAGLFFGLAVATRTSELIWLGPLLVLLWIFNLRRVGALRPMIFLLGAGLAFLPFLYQNQFLYGAPLYGGYGAMNASLAEISQAGRGLIDNGRSAMGAANDFLKTIFNNVFYFGLDFKLSLKTFYYYFAVMFSWLLVGGFWGLMILIGENVFRFRRRYLVYVLGLFLTTIILVLYYGSWQFNDNPDPKRFTIGNSYTRYWLPIYLFFLPLVSLFIVRISHLVLDGESGSRHRLPVLWSNALQILAVFIISISSLFFVAFGSEEGLVYLVHNNGNAKALAGQVIASTEPESVIITQYHDKFLFPERRVLVGLLNDDNMNYYYSRLAAVGPLYYYNFTFPTKDVDYLNNTKLAKFGLSIELIKQIDKDFSLYRLRPVVNNLEEQD